MDQVDLTVFKHIPLFRGLALKEVEFLQTIFEAHRMPSGKMVFLENMPGESLYLIQQGKVKVSQMLGEICEQDMVLLGPGEIFGQLALLDAEQRVSSARTVEDAVLYRLTREDFAEMARQKPRLGLQMTLNLARELSARLHRAKNDYRAAVSKLSC